MITCGKCKRALDPIGPVCEGCGPLAPIHIEGILNPPRACLKCSGVFTRRDPRDKSERICPPCKDPENADKFDLLNAKERRKVAVKYSALRKAKPNDPVLNTPVPNRFVESEEDEPESTDD